jgi:hypothetical protein
MAYDKKRKRDLVALAARHDGWELLDERTGKGYYILKHRSGARVYAPLTPGSPSHSLRVTEMKMQQAERRVAEIQKGRARK